jgi:VWFA-related protein
MTTHRIILTLFVALLPGMPTASAQLARPAISPSSQPIRLDVVVNTKSSQPVTSLSQQDFAILDNKSLRPITSFKVVTPAKEPVEVILFIDAVNTPFSLVAYMRNQTEQFLKAHEGTLAHPTTIAVLTDEDVQIDNSFSTDGNLLSDSLEHRQIGLREITRSSQWGGLDRLNICLKALRQVVASASALPGRKIILWISPGWPLLSGPHILLGSKQEQHIFSDVVSFSSLLRQANITLYNINPIGVSEPMMEATYYQSFLKGLVKPDSAQFGNLGLQVLAVQSGGLALESNSDVTAQIERCLTDANTWYEIAFDPLPADKPNEYHHIDVRLDQPGLIARTRDGYYANPLAVDPAH